MKRTRTKGEKPVVVERKNNMPIFVRVLVFMFYIGVLIFIFYVCGHGGLT